MATACYTQNRSLIHTMHNKTPYELVHDKKPDLSFLRIFGALCYPTNDSEDLGKLKAKADIGFFVGYAPNRKGYIIYNKRTRQIMETIHVTFDELTEQTALVHSSPGPAHNLLTPGPISYGLVSNSPPAAPYVPPTNKEFEILFQPVINNSEASSSGVITRTESNQTTQPHEHLRKWTASYPIDNIIGNPFRPVSTRKQLATDALWCFYNSVLSKVEPKTTNLLLLKTASFKPCKMKSMNLIDWTYGN
ncbi:retrovirus-related pol polyprotein from transposon TNT 1-94 [Tanacetum coccineum]